MIFTSNSCRSPWFAKACKEWIWGCGLHAVAAALRRQDLMYVGNHKLGRRRHWHILAFSHLSCFVLGSARIISCCIMGTCPHSSQTETLRCRAPTRTSRDPSHAGPARTKHHADILPHGRPRTVMAFTWIKLLNFTTSARGWNRPLCEAGNRLFPRRHAFGACSTRFLPADQTESRTE